MPACQSIRIHSSGGKEDGFGYQRVVNWNEKLFGKALDMRLALPVLKSRSLILSWALYDLANQFFALNVVSLYFVRWLTLEKNMPEIFYSVSFGISTLFVALSAPLLGAVSDETQRRRPFLVYLTLLSIVFTMLLGIPKSILLGLIFFAIANFGCQAAIVFYNALMLNIAPKNKIGLISGLGKMFGYSGAILALYLIKPIVLKSGYQAAFLPTGILFLIFSLPCMIFIKDKPSPKVKIKLTSFFNKGKIIEILKTLRHIAFDTYKYPGLSNFLKASFFALCSVNVVILFMSVYATQVFGLNEVQIINLLAFSTFFAIVGSLLSGFISDYLGHKRFLSIVFCLWIICFLLGALARDIRLYWFIGAMVGVALGSTWVVSRALAVSLAPEEKIGEVFGLFNLFGYLSGAVGSLFWGLILLFLHPLGPWGYRIALLSLIIFMLLGFIFLLRIPKQNKNK
ncbi:MAG: MFS transporter [Candidatus Omnitrophica bacterium]|nr:MFS transporter [Candidatus Omnitrophota bacterium]MBU4473207.1 MFS transporter [Candidatus Omnitrophota bacterium]MCG2706570.1 MFS transporter [Candidatus Omnitrophota bacterium]